MIIITLEEKNKLFSKKHIRHKSNPINKKQRMGKKNNGNAKGYKMKISLSIQELIREKMLANIDIDKVEHLVDDYNELRGFLSQTFYDLFNDNEYQLTTQDQKKSSL